MPRSDVWLAVASDRPEVCRLVLPAWRERGYRVALLKIGSGWEAPADRSAACERRPGWAAAINRLGRTLIPKDAGAVVAGADWLTPDPDLEAARLATEMLDRFPDGFGVMLPGGADGAGVVRGVWLGRGWIDRMYAGAGGLFDGHHGVAAEQEAVALATEMGVLWRREDVKQVRHPELGAGEVMAPVCAETEELHALDAPLHEARRAAGYPGHEPIEADDARAATAQPARPAAALPDIAERLMREALEHCARKGWARVGVYGAGLHTLRAGAALAQPPVEIVCIIDDNPDMAGRRLWRIPLVSRSEAGGLALDAVVISSDSIEEKLAAAAAPLREAGTRVLCLYDDEAQARLGERKLTAMFYPAFADAGQFTEHFHRMLWYLRPMLGDIEAVILPHALEDPTPGPAPAHLDSSLRRFEPEFCGKIRLVRADDDAAMTESAAAADVMLLWKAVEGTGEMWPPPPASRKPRKLFRVEHETNPHAGSNYLACSEQMNPRQKWDVEASAAKLADFLERGFGDNGYIFGTGPSLSAAMERDFSDGACIACNSMVCNPALMERLNPIAIAVADPIFHAGCSSYAGEFREHLATMMRRYDCPLFVPWRDYRVYMSNLDEDLRGRIIGVPGVRSDRPNLDLGSRFEVVITRNILTYFLLPIACTLFRTVNIMGCDGRPLKENDYFWRHDPSSQLVGRMKEIRDAHPGFFAIDYNEYYTAHCDTLRRWIESAEAQGRIIRNLSASHIPVLKEREAMLEGV
ncbi:MAG: hypothetical protein EA376_09500 [Phycisphaeraceae bacterium]|nr:MAG: hypothetical protein EA376_09500 [Phycisphaeraceae bacterium]